ncbi:MAG TPA: hypothetical protein PK447_08295 [Ignavibacteria bacterium]|nr:hypothetical protein [Ignavibacteria bacterium]
MLILIPNACPDLSGLRLGNAIDVKMNNIIVFVRHRSLGSIYMLNMVNKKKPAESSTGSILCG